MTEHTPAPTSAEETAPYGSATTSAPDSPGSSPATPVAAGPTTDPTIRRVRTHHLQQWKEQGHKWVMLTTYDQYTAATFDEAGIPVLFIGDSAANNVFGYESSLPVTVDELLPLVKAVTRTARRALVVADLPFGSYQRSPEQAYDTAVRFMKEGQAHEVKLEGGAEMAPQIELLTKGAIPVMAHIGFTPQSEHALGGYRVQGKNDAGALQLSADADAQQEAGASLIVLEAIPSPLAAQVTDRLVIPTIGIGAGKECSGQVLVLHDALDVAPGPKPRFVRNFMAGQDSIVGAMAAYVTAVRDGSFPAPEHCY